MKHTIFVIILSFVLSGCGIIDTFLVTEHEETAMQTDTPPMLYLGATEMNLGTYCVGLCVDTIPPAYEADAHMSIRYPSTEF